jgi:ATP-dependent DNA ligase
MLLRVALSAPDMIAPGCSTNGTRANIGGSPRAGRKGYLARIKGPAGAGLSNRRVHKTPRADAQSAADLGRAALVRAVAARYETAVSMRALPTGFVPPCLPTKAHSPPSGPLWLHEIKHDGFRVIASKDSGPRAALQPAGS